MAAPGPSCDGGSGCTRSNRRAVRASGQLRGLPRPGPARVRPLLPVRPARPARPGHARRRRGAHLLRGEGNRVRRRPVALQVLAVAGPRRAGLAAGPAAHLPARPRPLRVAARGHARSRPPGRGADRLRPPGTAPAARNGRPLPANASDRAGHQAGRAGPRPQLGPVYFRTDRAGSQRATPRRLLGIGRQRPVRGRRAQARGRPPRGGRGPRPPRGSGRPAERPAGRPARPAAVTTRTDAPYTGRTVPDPRGRSGSKLER